MVEIFFANTVGNSYTEMSAAAYTLLKTKLAEFFAVSAEDIAILKDEKGRPYVDGREDIFVSISHSHGMVMCGFSDSEIGVDVELVKTRRKSVESRVFTVGESGLLDGTDNENEAFFKLWTLKESYLKAIGTGFADNAKEIEFYSLDSPVNSNKSEFTFEAGMRDGFAYAVCIKRS